MKKTGKIFVIIILIMVVIYTILFVSNKYYVTDISISEDFDNSISLVVTDKNGNTRVYDKDSFPKNNNCYSYVLDTSKSYCDGDLEILGYENGNVSFSATGGGKCYIYLNEYSNIGNEITEYFYDNNNHIQTFTADKDGYYFLEAWGAQGGSTKKSIGGKGGFSSGSVYLNSGDTLYIVVGGKGESCNNTSSCTAKGGYNGGGNAIINGYLSSAGAGGGATHIANSLVDGTSSLLKNYENSRDNLIIVAGGGGGAAFNDSNDSFAFNGGSGGGKKGKSGTGNNNYGTGATQVIPGSSLTKCNGEFGLGASTCLNGSELIYGGAGGGGLYGGGASSPDGLGSGGGGSAYIGNPLLLDFNNTYEKTTISGVQNNDGMVRITYLSNNLCEN